MTVRINSNIVAMTAHRNLLKNDEGLNTSLVRLSSGLRINKAADDAAGLAIAEKLRSQIKGLYQASQNALDAISLIQTAEGALSETNAILQRLRELSVKGANDTLTASDRASVAEEITQLSREIDRIASATQFNTQSLLLGGSISITGVTLQVGPNANQILNLLIDTATASALGVLVTQLSVDSSANASASIAGVDKALTTITSARAKLGALINRLEHTIANLDVQQENFAAAESRIRDLDMAKEMAELSKNQILSQSSVSMLAQANQAPQSVLALLK